MELSRRSLLHAATASLGASLLGSGAFARGISRRRKDVKNIIFCVADGMAMSAVTSSDQYQELTEGKSSYWSTLLDRKDVVNGLQDCRSLSSIVTDSSAASSTWGCGRRIWNSQVNEYPDGTKLRTLANLMVEHGTQVGLVTTTTITHATPAGFAVNCEDRDKEDEIAKLYLDSGVKVLLGGGDRFFNPEIRKDKRDLYGEFRKKGYSVIKSPSELAEVTKAPVLGIFSNSHLPYTVDRNYSDELKQKTPTLKDMASKAIEVLKNEPNGFLLQIEGGRVDHGAHSNDVPAWLLDQIAFEDAVRTAIEFAEQDGQTLVVITTDHATGGPCLNGAGFEYFESTAGLKSVEKMRCSYGPLLIAIGPSPSRVHIQDVVRTKLGIELKAAEADALGLALKKEWPFRPAEFMASVNASLAMVLGNHSKITWTSGNHTSDFCLITALGPGSENFAGLVDNFTIFDILLGLKGIQWSNPTMSFADAKKAWDAKHPPEKIEDHQDLHALCPEMADWLARNFAGDEHAIEICQ